ncbi:hypothetical protein SAMN02799631_00991 [Methylobacterium sp. 174MFSha1.1]|uniref:hypothetical protein n=1 Tax=Methylobacterium sp. 174MFSha1.1 TaxID=1502749 RepID=UPI0008F21B11|nr:hypothetical protein [Methylobacterium sp. 174MFSha1.1]SFU50442.1 hypothetical protein SAMN02799631_00991 [Methylobacterium sp. 174MFSha1.1]
MTTTSTTMMMAAGLALATVVGGAGQAEARGFGHGGFGRGGFGHHGGFGYRGGYGHRGFGHGGFGYRGRFYGRGYRHRFGGLGFGYPVSLGAYDGECRVVFSAVLGGYTRICG